MNRPGQPQQRPPNLAPNPGLAGPFRGPYPSYGMPPRTVIQAGYVPALQPSNHRTAAQQSQTQNMLSQPSPGFIQQRGQTAFPFGGGLGQVQTPSQPQQHSSNSQQPSQLANGTSSLPPHLMQTSSTPASAPPASAGEVALDPNDFPALGSTPLSVSNASSSNGNSGNGATSYASQAGTSVPLGGATSASTTSTAVGGMGAATGTANQPRDFTPDDFPALGGQVHPQTQGQTQNPPPPTQNQDGHPHPPGLNGFQHNDHSQQHRQSLLGTLGGSSALQQGTPGMLNLGAVQTRNVHPGFQQGQTEADKQQQRNNYALKLNQSANAAWNSPNVTSSSQSQLSAGAFATSSTIAQPNGTHPTSNTTQPSSQQQQSQHLNAPPGVPLPSGSYVTSAHAHASSTITNTAAGSGSTYPSNGVPPGDAHSNPNQSVPNPHGQLHANTHPQTPAQQVLMSAADRWGLLGLLAMIKNAGSDMDHGLTSVGTDLGTMGLDMEYHGNLYSTFITPWTDQSSAHTVEPDFHLPGCYNVQTQAPGPVKAAAFSDETLFFMFYSSPRDALQEVAAQELWNRNWRFHKDLRLWITKETGASPSQKVPGGEQGVYTIWDHENWVKERKEMTVLYADLEEKSVPVFAQGPGLVLAHGQSGQGQQTQGQQTQLQQGQAAVQTAQRGSFPMSMAGL